MKFLQLNISSLNTSLYELWLHQQAHNYNAIFLQETNHKDETKICGFKNWKSKLHTVFDSKTLGYGVGTFIMPNLKSVFRQDLIMENLEMIWNEIDIDNKKILIGNIYVPPNNVDQLHKLDNILEKLKDQRLIIVGDFNARNKMWDKHSKINTKLGIILEDIIQHHGLYIATNVDHTYHHSPLCDTSGKSTIDLTLTRGIRNVNIKTIDMDLSNIKTRHKAIEIQIEEKNLNLLSKIPHFKTKNAKWNQWANTLDKNLESFFNSFSKEISENIVEERAVTLTDIIVTTATNFFGLTETSKKESKGWWNSEIKNARNDLKKSKNVYSKRQTPANYETLVRKKQILQTLISNSKTNLYKKNSDFLNQSKDANQFWHRYGKVIGTKTYNLVEPLFDSVSNSYIFEDHTLSNIFLIIIEIKISKIIMIRTLRIN